MRKIQELWGDHPVVDLIIVVLVCTLLLCTQPLIFTANGLAGFANAVVTTAGLAMAAATFVGTILYQSVSPLMRQVIHAHHAAVSRNWLFIIGSNLVICVTASFLVGFADQYPWHVERLTLGALTLVLLECMRALWWMRQIAKVDKAQADRDRKIVVQPAADLNIPEN